MARHTVSTAALQGIDAIQVDVEVDARPGKRCFEIIGLGDGAVREARGRVDVALQRCGFQMPERVLVNLAPAEVRKEGSSFDLPIALGILHACGVVSAAAVAGRRFFGELAFDGSIRPVRGVVAYAIEAVSAGAQTIVVPRANAGEAQLISGIDVVPVEHLLEVLGYLRGEVLPEGRSNDDRAESAAPVSIDEVVGQQVAKQALRIAAAGGHNLLMIGPPGCGKSMLAERFPSLLPPLGEAEMLEVARIHSIAGHAIGGILAGMRPVRSPHHSISEAGLIGGGSPIRPGEVSYAHGGVLFLDEFPEYRRAVIEGLRAPLEAGHVRISRARGSSLFPARVQLIAAMNPCPCGRSGVKGATCICSPGAIQAYMGRLSQPILERIDLHVELDAVPMEQIVRGAEGRDHRSLRDSVIAARNRQHQRQGCLNSGVSRRDLQRLVVLTQPMVKLLEQAEARFGLSARTFVRVLRVARTIADLESRDGVTPNDIASALSFRCLERAAARVSSAAPPRYATSG